MKILIIDIETAPNIAHVWGLFKQNIAVNQLMESSYILCWAAKWLGKKEMFFKSIHDTTEYNMVKTMHELLEEADVVMHFNGASFDVPTLNNAFVEHGLAPPAPFKQLDILKTARAKFRLPSNKLEYVSRFLGVGRKVQHYGHELWVDCMKGDERAWKIMERYNKMDVRLLERVYNKLKPWIKTHPSHALYDDELKCNICKGKKLIKRGFAYTNVFKYQRYQCKKCGAWLRGRRSIKTDSFVQVND
jgi:DNA polymerase elongation subunit (family B)